MPISICYLLPAYGAKYVSETELVNAWEEGKDFRIFRGPYCSIRDLDTLGHNYDAIYGIFGAGDERHRVCLFRKEPQLVDKHTT